MFTEADIISTYTRAQAIEDGELADVSKLASECGFRYPVAITGALHNVISDIPKGSGQSYTGRLWDVLFMSMMRIRGNKQESRVGVTVLMSLRGKGRRKLSLFCDVGPGDEGEPVITIGFPEDF